MFPSGPLLVPVTLLAASFSPPALAVEPETQVAPPMSLVAADGTLTLDVDATDARAAAVALVIRHLRTGEPRVDRLESWEIDEARRSIARGEAWPIPDATGGRVRATIAADALRDARQVWGVTFRWHDRIRIGMSPIGPVVLGEGILDLPLQPGDVLTKIGGRKPPPSDDFDRATAYAVLELLRAGEPVQVDARGPEAGPVRDDRRKLAPTCGPCCHGGGPNCRDGWPSPPKIAEPAP